MKRAKFCGVALLCLALLFVFSGCAAQGKQDLIDNYKHSKSFTVNAEYQQLTDKYYSLILENTTEFEVKVDVFDELGKSEILAGNHMQRTYILLIQINRIDDNQSEVKAFYRSMNKEFKDVFDNLEAWSGL